jgi:hypothetical protein
MSITPGNGLRLQARPSTGAATLGTAGGTGVAPYWVKLVRTGDTITAYKATDSVNWSLVGSNTVTMAPTVYVGLAVASHNNTKLVASTLNNVTVTQP